jgi:hypothetical protein
MTIYRLKLNQYQGQNNLLESIRKNISGRYNPKTETSVIKLQDPEAETGGIA